MESDGFRSSIEEIYKFLREKINTRLSEALDEQCKERLYSFDFDKLYIINSKSKIVEYDQERDLIIISDGFLTDELKQKISNKHPEFKLERVKEKISNGEVNIFSEELILFSNELGLKEKDIIKSMLIQEILKMVYSNKVELISNQVIIDSASEFLAHDISLDNGFIASTPIKRQKELELGLLLRKKLENDFEKFIFADYSQDKQKVLESKKITKSVEELAEDRKIIESTQNLDEVVETINEIVEEENQLTVVEIKDKSVIKFIDESGSINLFSSQNNEKFLDIFHELKKQKSDGQKVLKKELVNTLKDTMGEGFFEEFNIDDKVLEKKKKEWEPETEDIEQEEIIKIDSDEVVVPKEEIIKDEVIPINNNKKIILSIVVILVTILLGIFVGWLLFNIK